MESMPSGAPPRASEWDREYMRRLGRFKHESHEDARRRHLALSGKERLIAAIAPALQVPYFVPRYPVAEDDPAPLYERAKTLGFYRA